MKFSSSLPKGDNDGMSVIAHDLVQSPERVHLVCCIVTTKAITQDLESHSVEATVRIMRAEVIQAKDKDELELGLQLMRRAMERRHGGEMLDIQVEDELSDLFDQAAQRIIDEADEKVDDEKAAAAEADDADDGDDAQ